MPNWRIFGLVNIFESCNDLVVINFSMDENDPLLSHQIEAVRALAQFFRKVYVITGHRGTGSIPDNVTVFDLQWNHRNSFWNFLNFYFVAFRVVFKSNMIIFSHMTDVQAALISPFVRIRGNRHYLWYAHKSFSKYLRWSSFWVNGIVTSTPGSCPAGGEKTFPIGQALRLESFEYTPKLNSPINCAIHVGRFDPSKDLYGIAENFIELRNRGFNVNFTQVGDPSTQVARSYEQSFRKHYNDYIQAGVFSIKSSLPRRQIAEELRNQDFFVHAYLGSLDKTLIEATLVGLPVVTLNEEYQSLFGTWSNSRKPTLVDEFEALNNLSKIELENELLKRRLYAERNHSLANWTTSLISILYQE